MSLPKRREAPNRISFRLPRDDFFFFFLLLFVNSSSLVSLHMFCVQGPYVNWLRANDLVSCCWVPSWLHAVIAPYSVPKKKPHTHTQKHKKKNRFVTREIPHS
jgi:hypothetical protein